MTWDTSGAAGSATVAGERVAGAIGAAVGITTGALVAVSAAGAVTAAGFPGAGGRVGSMATGASVATGRAGGWVGLASTTGAAVGSRMGGGVARIGGATSVGIWGMSGVLIGVGLGTAGTAGAVALIQDTPSSTCTSSSSTDSATVEGSTTGMVAAPLGLVAGTVPLVEAGRVAFWAGRGTTGGLTLPEFPVELAVTTDSAVTLAPPSTTTPVVFPLTVGEVKLAEATVPLADTLAPGREGRLPLLETTPAAAVATEGREALTGREALGACAFVPFTTAEADAFSAAPTAPTAAVATEVERPETFTGAGVGQMALALFRVVGMEGRGTALVPSSSSSPTATRSSVPSSFWEEENVVLTVELMVETGVGSTVGSTDRGTDESSAGSGSKGLGTTVGSPSSPTTAGARLPSSVSTGLRIGGSVTSGRGSITVRGSTSVGAGALLAGTTSGVGVGVGRGVSTICLDEAPWACWTVEAITATSKLAVKNCPFSRMFTSSVLCRVFWDGHVGDE
eukprot:evm.model.NODE_14053_length_24851_cov_29.928293.10